jgi:hypothetical protein
MMVLPGGMVKPPPGAQTVSPLALGGGDLGARGSVDHLCALGIAAVASAGLADQR